MKQNNTFIVFRMLAIAFRNSSSTAGEKEKLLDTGLADKAGYIRLVRELGRKYVA